MMKFQFLFLILLRPTQLSAFQIQPVRKYCHDSIIESGYRVQSRIRRLPEQLPVGWFQLNVGDAKADTNNDSSDNANGANQKSETKLITPNEALETNVKTTSPALIKVEKTPNPTSVAMQKRFEIAMDRSKKVVSTLFNKKFGTRGEAFILAQAILLYSITIGHVPLLKRFFTMFFGPAMFLAGAGVTALSVKEMGGAFTAFSTPVSKHKHGRLVMTGLYDQVRHPVYAGNIVALVGLSIMSKSAMRLVLTGFYCLLIEMKTRKEEFEMKKTYGLEYTFYCKRVSQKFIPTSLLIKTSITKEERKEEPTWKLSLEKDSSPAVNGEQKKDETAKSTESRLFP